LKDAKSAVKDEDDSQVFNTSSEIEKSILPSLANFLEKLDYELLKAY